MNNTRIKVLELSNSLKARRKNAYDRKMASERAMMNNPDFYANGQIETLDLMIEELDKILRTTSTFHD